MGPRQDVRAHNHRFACRLARRISLRIGQIIESVVGTDAAILTAMPAEPPVRTKIIAVVVATIAALFCRAWLELELLADGYHKYFAADLSYLVVPPILLILLFPIWRLDGALISSLYRRRGLSLTIVLNAIAIGFLLRTAAWCELVAGVSLGWYSNPKATTIGGPTFTFGCPEPDVLLLGVAVMVVLVPIVEETTNRGLIQSWLSERGPNIAICSQALLFMLAHRPSSWGFAFVAGVVLGIQCWRTKSLWASLITHATINGLIQLDWRCTRGNWNPPPSEVPIWSSGIISILALILALLSIAILLREKTGVHDAPRK
ncbi:MAG: CPBP family intramembrane glutamic endopeptidase [Woeseiaceae bacterium]